MGEAIDIKDYVTEARVKEDSAIAGQTVSELRKHADQEVMVTAVVRDQQTAAPLPDMVLQARRHRAVEGEPAALERAVAARIWSWKARIAPFARRRSRKTRLA